jgi:environmental stress-induced protein Ves
MEYSIIPFKSFKIIAWAGGTSTELFVFPAISSYHKQDFQFRLSRATVESEKSEFTTLKGVSRKMMVLDGEITICHEGHYSRQLKKFDTDEFMGDWKTSSVGKCTDLNLMTRGETTGSLKAIAIGKDQDVNYTIEGKCDWFFIYAYCGKATISTGNGISDINTGDLLMMEPQATMVVTIKGIDVSELIICEIFF